MNRWFHIGGAPIELLLTLQHLSHQYTDVETSSLLDKRLLYQHLDVLAKQTLHGYA